LRSGPPVDDRSRTGTFWSRIEVCSVEAATRVSGQNVRQSVPVQVQKVHCGIVHHHGRLVRCADDLACGGERGWRIRYYVTIGRRWQAVRPVSAEFRNAGQERPVRVGAGVTQVIQHILSIEIIGSSVPVEVTGCMIGQYLPLRADNDLPETLAGAHDKSGAAVLEPIRTVFVSKRDEMEIVPRRRTRTIRDPRYIFLIEIIRTGKVRVRVDNSIAVGVGFLLKQPGEDVVGAGGILNASVCSQAELKARAIRKGADPVIAHLEIPDESALVFAKKKTVGERD